MTIAMMSNKRIVTLITIKINKDNHSNSNDNNNDESNKANNGNNRQQQRTSNNDAVLGVWAPHLKQLPGQAALHHAGRRHDHTRPNVLKLVHPLKPKGEI